MTMTISKERIFIFICLSILVRGDVCSSISNEKYESSGFYCNGKNTIKVQPGHNLCDNKLTFDCTNQVESVNSQSRCKMKVIDTSECTDDFFKGDVNKQDIQSVGTINLTPYLFCEIIPFSAINISLPTTHWKRIKIRYIEDGMNIGRNCREFELSGEDNITSKISYDCPFDNQLGGKIYRFQYVITTKDGKDYLSTYLFKVPMIIDMNAFIGDQYHIFMMIEESDYTLKVQVPPKVFNVSWTNITLYYKEKKDSIGIIKQTKGINLTDKEEKEFISPFEPLASYRSGFYYFNATFYSSHCKHTCEASVTPDIYIKGWGPLSEVLAAVFLISLMALFLVIYLTWKSKYSEVDQGPEKPPNVLLIYESIYPSHIEDIYKFKEYLEDNCFINVKLDLIDIPKTDSKDPWEWYVKAFEKADNVLVFASPCGDVEQGLHPDNVYHNLHMYAYKLLIFYLLHKNKYSKVAGIRLPGCSWDTFPAEAQIISRNCRVALPEQLVEFFKFLKVPPVIDGASKLTSILRSPRNPPTLLITKPPPNPRYPEIDEEDDEIRKQLEGFTFDSRSEEEDDDDDDEEGNILEGFKLGAI